MRILRFLLCIVCCVSVQTAQAAESAWVSADHVQARLISSGDEIAVQIRMTKGWHTYWRVPGDAGLPPRFDWSGSENIADVEIQWPAPQRFEEFGLYTFGYMDEVIFPARIMREEAELAANMHLKLDVMMCNDICIPQTITLEMVLGSAPVAKIMNFGRRSIPVHGDTVALKLDTVVAGPEGLVLSVYSKKGFGSVDVFAVVDDFAFTSPPEIIVDEHESRRALIKIPKPGDIEDLATYLSSKKLNITLTSGHRAIEKMIGF